MDGNVFERIFKHLETQEAAEEAARRVAEEEAKRVANEELQRQVQEEIDGKSSKGSIKLKNKCSALSRELLITLSQKQPIKS